MRKIILIVYGLFFVSVLSYSQNKTGKITYQVSLTYTIERLKKYEEKFGVKTYRTRETIKNSKDVEAILEFTPTLSKYYIVEPVTNDKIEKPNWTYTTAGYKSEYFNNKITKQTLRKRCMFLDECYLIEQPEEVKWQLTQETKIIGGYLCYKAIHINSKNKKMKPVAWYTPDIPVGFGPKEFFGLPGLILELEESIIIFKVKSIALNPKEKIVINPPKGKRVTKKEYNKLLRKAYPDFFKK